VNLLHGLPLLRRPPDARHLAPPLQDFQGVRGRFKVGCFKLRRCGHTVTWNFLSREMLMPKVFN